MPQGYRCHWMLGECHWLPLESYAFCAFSRTLNPFAPSKLKKCLGQKFILIKALNAVQNLPFILCSDCSPYYNMYYYTLFTVHTIYSIMLFISRRAIERVSGSSKIFSLKVLTLRTSRAAEDKGLDCKPNWCIRWWCMGHRCSFNLHRANYPIPFA